MKLYISTIAAGCALLLTVSACSNEAELPRNPDGKMAMDLMPTHPALSRASDAGFEAGDKVGVFVVENGKRLEIGGNNVNNESLAYDGLKWTPAHPLFWDKGTYNIYAYYPHRDEVTSVTDLPIAVALDQSITAADGKPGAYEASDFLYASAKKIEASAATVPLQFRHLLSKLTIRLVKGEGYEGEIPEHAQVIIHNTVAEATVDLAAGVATRHPRATAQSITALQSGETSYTAIIVPQRLNNRVPLVEVIMEGVSYLFESKFNFRQGMHHIVNLVIDTNPEQIKIEIGGEITDWDV